MVKEFFSTSCFVLIVSIFCDNDIDGGPPSSVLSVADSSRTRASNIHVRSPYPANG
jgi:hypothetical protein